MKSNIKLILLFCCFFITAGWTTGCKIESMKSPEKLLEKPVTNEFNNKIYNDIRKLTPIDTTFILPKNAKEVGKINKVDLDGDQSYEIVAFKKKINENQDVNSIYMYIFEYEGDSILDDSEKVVRISGDSIKYANFIDVDNDGKKEIILHVSNKGFENIYIYDYTNNSIKKQAEYSTLKYAVKLNFYDYQGNGRDEGFAILQDRTSYDAIIAKMKIEGNEIVFDKFETSKNIDSLDKVDIINGKVSKNQNGSMVVYQNFDGSIVTQIIIYKDGKFRRALSGDDGKLKNPNLVKPQDINGDRVLEIPKIEYKYSNGTPKDSNVIAWYLWNGKLEKDSKLNLVKQIFYSYNYNFMLNIPKKLENQFLIKHKYNTNKNTFEFYQGEEEGYLEPLFNIVVVAKNNDELEVKGKAQEQQEVFSDILLENEDYMYVYKAIADKNILLNYNVDFKSVKKMFHIINK